MAYFFQLTMTGLSLGLIYATVALGIMLLFSAAGVMNFAQGSLLALGAYIGWELMYKMSIPGWILKIVVMFLLLVFIGIIFASVCFLPFKKAKWRQAMLICTMGMAIILPEICLILISAEQQRMDPIFPGSLQIGSFTLSYQYLFIFVVMIIVMSGIFILFERTYVGNILTAASQNRFAADLLGIPTDLTTIITFCTVVVLVGFAGWMIAPIFLVRTSLNTFQSKAFASIIIGGYGTLKGAIVGGILVGLVEAYSAYFTTLYQDVVIYGVLLLVLAIMPSGIVRNKQNVKEKA
ncbi:MAG: branched-chain amino acid ABC transporter permease [Lachnospiraceae bacterium]|nr:branched-chain amino acid ABC transporter permease [Lachnospiraceae bacterium]